MGIFSQTRTRSPKIRGQPAMFRWIFKLERTVPVGDVLVCDSGGDIEHDDTALAIDVVTVS